MKAEVFSGAPFQGVRETQIRTGLSPAALYRGAKDGTYPCIRVGNRILFNLPALLEVLDAASRKGGQG